ncbi:MAG: hypothetical protein FWG20_02290 [Candidatus Cloacimonetes bacterium]|nr:hypothetical protein [Candidatus Cloacimonadota bacterium]
MLKSTLIIEIGTNSIKSLIARKEGSDFTFQNIPPLYTRLGEGLHKEGLLSPLVIKRNIEAIAKIIEQSPAEEKVIIATQGLRTAKNAREVTDTVRERFNITIRILSAEEEAICSYHAVSDNRNPFVIDIGGGSTELICKTHVHNISCPVGAVFLKEMFPKTFYEFTCIDDFLFCAYKILKGFVKLENHSFIENNLVGIGGTFTAIAMLYKELTVYEESVIDSTEISYDDIKKVLRAVYEATETFVKNDGRSDILPFGIAIALFVMDAVKASQITVSTKGVRHGYVKLFCN